VEGGGSERESGNQSTMELVQFSSDSSVGEREGERRRRASTTTHFHLTSPLCLFRALSIWLLGSTDKCVATGWREQRMVANLSLSGDLSRELEREKTVAPGRANGSISSDDKIGRKMEDERDGGEGKRKRGGEREEGDD